MKANFLTLALAAALAANAFAADKTAASQKTPDAKPTPAAFKTESEKAAYALGANIGSNLHRQGLDPEILDTTSFARGFSAALGGSQNLLLTEQEMSEVLRGLQQTVITRRKTANEKFLADNKAKPGVTTLPSGLQYKILTPGQGDSPKDSDTVTVNYRGTLTDGKEFDSSYKRGQPATFPVTGVIKGWTEALKLMQPGAKWQLVIPSNLAYGERGNPSIPPDSTLIFEVELISATPAPAPAPQPAPQPITSDIIRVPSAEEMKKGAKIETIKAEDVAKYTSTNKPAAK